MPSNKDALEEMKAFLESVPPNVSVRIPGLAKEYVSGEFGASRYWGIVGSSPSRLDLHCNVDDGVRRFSGFACVSEALWTMAITGIGGRRDRQCGGRPGFR